MMIRGRSEGRSRNPAYDVDRFSADLLGFVIPSPLSTAWHALTGPAYRHLARSTSNVEIVTFLGVVPLALAAVALRSGGRTVERSRGWRWCSPCWRLARSYTYGERRSCRRLTELMPYTWLARLPYGDIPRVPARFVVMASAALASGTALQFFAAEEPAARHRRRR
jgi:hypothetical protein